MEDSSLYKAVRYFVDCINATGGVTVNNNGYHAPVADPTWTDLGYCYMLACKALDAEPRVAETTEQENSLEELA